MAIHPHKYKLVYKPNFTRTLAVLVDHPRPLPIFGLDIETAKHPNHLENPKAGLTPNISSIRLVQIADPLSGIVYIFDMWTLSPNEKARLLSFIKGEKFFAHYAQFEAAHFQHAGIENLDVHCTQIMYRMLIRAETPDTKEIGGSLQAVVQDILKITISKAEQSSDWNAPELTKEQIEYAGRDAAYVAVLGPAFLKKIMKDMPRAYEINRRMINPLARMTRTGIFFDAKAHKKQVKVWVKDHAVLEKKLIKKYGEMNFNSYKQLGILLKKNFTPKELLDWPRTPSGAYATDQDTLFDFSHLPGIKDLCEYKGYAKKISTYGESLIKEVNPVSKRIHASYSLAHTDTDRLSSWQPNLQNLPRGKEVRRNFRNQYKKTVLIGGDFSQVEAKVAALISGDPDFIRIFVEGKDLYTAVASNVLNLPYDAIAKDSQERQIGKSLALGLLFGMGATKYQQYAWVNFGVKLTKNEAFKLHEAFFDMIPTYREWQKEQAEEAASTQAAFTLGGMKRRLSERNYYCCSMNTPIQGSAAEMIKCAMVRIDATLRKKKLKARLVNCVHDSINIEAFDVDAKRVLKLMKRDMQRGFKDIIPDTKGIKHLVDVGMGKTWADVK